MKANEKYASLFERVKLGPVEVRNRFGTSAMGTFGEDHRGLLTPALIEYYATRARGGIGLVMMEGQFVTDKLSEATAGQMLYDSEAQMKQWALAAESIHAWGAKAGVQLTPGNGRTVFAVEGGPVPVAPSAVPASCNPNIICRALTHDEVRDIVAAFGRCAERAHRAEFDVIEINCHSGFLLDQFITEAWNQRDDEYGGSFENRMRIISEIYEAMRAVAGKDTALGFRVGLYHGFDGGRTVEEGLEICRYAEKLGFDYLNIDFGCEENCTVNNPSIYIKDGTYIEAARLAKQTVAIPVMCSGAHTPETARAAVKSGAVDMVLLGRPSIADPEIPRKLLEGGEEDVRPCLLCNQYCIGRLYAGRQITCAVNPIAGRELDFPFVKTGNPKKVAVIGGGVGGMVAAATAARTGHSVTLYEAGDVLGGGLAASARIDFKERYRDYLAYLTTQLDETDVEVVLGKEITGESPELTGVDEIIISVGATPIRPDIPDGSVPVTTAYWALMHPEAVGGDAVVVLGDSSIACDSAIEYGAQGKNVTIIGEGRGFAEDLINIPDRIAAVEKMAAYGVKQISDARLVGFTQDGVRVGTEDGEQLVKADTVVLALGFEPNTAVRDEIVAAYPQARDIGDCVKVGKIGDAARAGYFAAWAIE